MLKGFTRKFKPLEILTEEQLEVLHKGAMDVLENTGVKVDHDRALKLLAKNGCKVDFGEQRVRMSNGLVEECLRKCPSSYTIEARDPEYDVRIGGNTLYFLQGMGMRYVDLNTWEFRPATLQEHREAVVVGDALDNLHIGDACFAYTDFTGVPAVMGLLEGLASGLRNSSKAQHFGYSKGCEVFAIKMAKELGITIDAELDIASPLTFYRDSVEALYRYAEAGFGVHACPSASPGATGPATIAGTIVSQHAATAAFIVIAQLIKPGLPVLPMYSGPPLHISGGHPITSTTHNALLTLPYNQLYRRYGIPVGTTCGFSSNSKKLDFQCGYEKALGTLVSCLGGTNYHVFQGGLAEELAFSTVLSILDDDIAGWIGHMIEGFEITEETLALDLINEVGTIPGTFLNKEHTRKWWVKERFTPKVADMETYPEWIQKGKIDALSLAKEKKAEILEEYEPKPLTNHEEQVIENVMKEAREYYKKEGFISDDEWQVYMETLESEDLRR